MHPGALTRNLALFAALLCAAPLTPATAEGADAPLPLDAIWKVRSVKFRYSSPTTFYDCATLRQRVEHIMLTVGASELMHVKTRCSMGSLSNNASIRMVVGVPIEATKENLIAETTFNRHTQRIAKARNWTLATPETVHRFRAEIREVSFANFNPSDCELLEAMSEQVFPQLGIQLKRRSSCGGAMPFNSLIVDALVATTLP